MYISNVRFLKICAGWWIHSGGGGVGVRGWKSQPTQLVVFIKGFMNNTPREAPGTSADMYLKAGVTRRLTHIHTVG